MPGNKKIIFAALDWGIGHATRMIPIIKYSIEQDHDILLLSDGDALDVWKKEFPNLSYKSLPSYGVKYRYENITLNVLLSSPGIMRALIAEKFYLNKLLLEFPADLIISDNRYGIRKRGIPSILISHQLNLPVDSPWLSKFATVLHNQLLQKFDAVWVPDYRKKPGISGDLSHPAPIENVYYIGPLSRFEHIENKKSYNVVAVISGPEPQRSILESKLIKQLSLLPGKNILVAGLPHREQAIRSSAQNLMIYNFLNGKELNQIMGSANMLVSRSGYSTLMDLAVLQVPALLVPTPGQREQEYLARSMDGNYNFIVQDQHSLNVREALRKLKDRKNTRDARPINGSQACYKELMKINLNR